ncbi:hypothetical protein E6W36_04040 [Hankyongella ginsenosidimutans]|uniref:ATP-grasp domain-containing protein n=2 Tax=Hankyongella ginsenosidimutans TaxID=1763828 RepID=A0A4D7CBS2_9SPHN|nr:hypothetical protein E6W36_04040 [Hankyongella ginsenosidimutans]
MPPLEPADPPISFFEFWPMTWFYAPVWAYILWLMLRHGSITVPLSANPSFEAGGLVGESKSQILALARQAAPEHVADFTIWDRPAQPADIGQEAADVLAAIQSAGLELPLVAKPDRGCRGAGVRVIRDRAVLERYLAAFPSVSALCCSASSTMRQRRVSSTPAIRAPAAALCGRSRSNISLCRW